VKPLIYLGEQEMAAYCTIKGIPYIYQECPLAEGATSLLSSIAGQVQLTRQQVSIIDIVEIGSDIDFETGNIESPTNILINGTVRDAFSVRSAKNISIRGAVEAATIEAGGDIQILGGVASRHQGTVTANGAIHTKFCAEAHLRAVGDITIARECLNSHIHTCGRLLVSQGKVVGGFAYARQGAEIKVLGNEADRKTEIAIGLDPAAMIQAKGIDHEIKKKKEISDKIREKVQPLLAQLKRLTPQQRERATELMYQADAMEAEIEENDKKKQEVLANSIAYGKSSLIVTSSVHPGVKVIFGNKMATFRQERRGPIKIERRLIERVEEICIIDRSSGSVTVMPSYDYEPDAPNPEMAE